MLVSGVVLNDRQGGALSLYNDLMDAFINYQYRLDNPFPGEGETWEVIINKFQCDPVFNKKVLSLVSGVMAIVSKHIQDRCR